MSGLSNFRCSEDEFLPIYLRVKTQPFTHLDVADLIIPQVVTKYANNKYFLPVKTPDGRRLRSKTHALIWRINPDVVRCCEKAIAEQNDHRWENLAAGQTGEGSA